MSREVIEALVPPTGWHYIQDGVRIPPERADSFRDLLRRVTEYRIHNHLPLGDVYSDVRDFVCQFPNQCSPEYTGIVTANYDEYKPKGLNFVQRIIKWADELQAKSYSLENNQRSFDRMQVCKNCPKAKSWESGCPSCSSYLHEILVRLRRGISTESTIGCESFGFDCQTAVLMEKGQLPNAIENVPDQCWMRR